MINDDWQLVVSSLRYFTFSKFYLLKPEVKEAVHSLINGSNLRCIAFRSGVKNHFAEW